VSPYSNTRDSILFDHKFWNSEVGKLAMIRSTQLNSNEWISTTDINSLSFITHSVIGLLRWSLLYSLGSDRTERPSPTVLLLLYVYSLPRNASLVWWHKSMFTVPLRSNGWSLLLGYSVVTMFYLTRSHHSLS
jgi:hypothetical protein